ncbi:MAG: deoxynucleoside kinase [Deltaproteobacteria bacterium]|nr:deoxynucleoside kinase [Deltaproteobacteria bacterium]
MFVAVAGNIGTGKTTLTGMLSKRFGWEPHYEVVVDNPYLADFYDNMTRWSFPIQIFFLNTRFKAHQRINQSLNSAIQDRSIYEDANIFARNLFESGHMEKRDYHNYLDLYEEMCKHLTPPDLLIYLRKSLPKLKSNITQRGRDYETKISDDYLSNLNRYYDEWIERYRTGKVLVIDSDNLDFVKRPEDFDKVGQQIFAQLDQQEMFLPR